MKTFSGPDCLICHKPVFYNLFLNASPDGNVKTLEQLIIDKMVMDSHTCKEARYSLPGVLLEKLLSASLYKLRELSVLQLIQAWKYPTLKLSLLIPNFGNDLFGLNESGRSHNILHEKYMCKIFKMFFHALIEKPPENLRHVDLSDLPIAYEVKHAQSFSSVDQSWMERMLGILNRRGIKISVNMCFTGLASLEFSNNSICEPPKGICFRNINGTAVRKIVTSETIDPLKVTKLGISNGFSRISAVDEWRKDAKLLVSEIGKFKNIQDLCFHVNVMDVDTIKCLLEGLNNLKRLDIDVEKLKTLQLDKLLPSSAQHLEYLRVYIYSLRKEDVKALELCREMRHLCLHAARQTLSDLQTIINTTQCLEQVLPKLEKLQVFELDTRTKLQSDFVTRLPALCPSIEALKLNSSFSPTVQLDYRSLLERGLKWLVSLHYRPENTFWDNFDDYHDIQEIKGDDLSDELYAVFRYPQKALIAYNRSYSPPKSWFDYFKSQYSFWDV